MTFLYLITPKKHARNECQRKREVPIPECLVKITTPNLPLSVGVRGAYLK